LRGAALGTGHREYVFTDQAGKPLSQEWLQKRIWLPTLRRCGLHAGAFEVKHLPTSLIASVTA